VFFTSRAKKNHGYTLEKIGEIMLGESFIENITVILVVFFSAKNHFED
jgi:hypothetical protein